jgi:hypothetical protein
MASSSLFHAAMKFWTFKNTTADLMGPGGAAVVLNFAIHLIPNPTHPISSKKHSALSFLRFTGLSKAEMALYYFLNIMATRTAEICRCLAQHANSIT